MARTTHLMFLWHMHQPDYGLPGQRRNLLPWVRLHATKAYLDMPWMLERFPKVKACINLSGSLLKQLVDTIDHQLTDVWYELSARDPAELGEAERRFLMANFFSIHWERHIRPNPGYWGLLQRRGPVTQDIKTDRFSNADFLDLQVHFNLAWMGFAARRDSPLVQRLLAKGGGYTHDEKRALLEEQHRILRGILPRYRALVERGQVELTTTPLYHPILPLLIDTDAARRCQPERALPRRFAWPEDARWHVRAAYDQHAAVFGAPPSGMWPAEGSVSPEALGVFAQEGVKWVATDEGVLMASEPRPAHREEALYRPWRASTPSGPLHVFFRDHDLSDRIGFVYAGLPAEEAAADLLRGAAESAKRAPDLKAPVVSVILDGENPWEAYSQDGEPFLQALYERLTQRDDLVTVLPSEYLAQHGDQSGELTRIHSASWIRSNFQIWQGHEETNTAWNLLGDARRALDLALKDTQRPLSQERQARAWDAIHAAEGSDWFWWYGDDFESQHKPEFDDLFRGYVRAVYEAIGEPSPARLERPVSLVGLATPKVEPPHALISPRVEGRVGHYFKWTGAGRYEPQGGAGAMFKARQTLDALYFGFDLERLYVRLDPGADLSNAPPQEVEARVLVRRASPEAPTYRARVSWANPSPLALERVNAQGVLEASEPLESAAVDEIFELSLPFAALGLRAGEAFELSVVLLQRGLEIDRHPPHGGLALTVPDPSFERRHWLI
jgi:alpha-amylase/alpha-mannosidase (GH57 family)